MKRSLALALLLAASCGRQADGTGPESFALSLPVEPAPGAQVQRVELPPAALVALRRADKGDLRIFDARGKPLSIALLGADKTPLEAVHLAAIPVAAAAGRAGAPPVSVRVERAGQSVAVDTAGGETTAGQSSVLFDTRKFANPAVAIEPEAQLPVQRPVTITVEAGSDLKSWEWLGERVLFRPGDGAALLGTSRIPLPGALLKDKYLRLGWSGAEGVSIAGATLLTAKAPPPPRIAIPAGGLRLADAHALQFAMPPGPGPSAMVLNMTGRDGVVPVSLLGRNAPEQPWTPLAMAVLRQGEGGALLERTDGMREYKFEADARSAGFSETPGLVLQFDTVSLLAAFNGAGPYTLAVGNAKAAPMFLAASDLAPGQDRFTMARVEGTGALARIDLAQDPGDARYAPRNLVLWGALLLGVLVLAIAAYRLLRVNSDMQA